MRDEQYATMLDKSEDILLTVYQGKPKKNVLLLSTLQTDAAIAYNQKKTPKTIKNKTKFGVDVVDLMARYYIVRTRTRRWHVYSFQNTLDLTAINAWILYKEINSIKILRRQFLQNLAEKLGMSFFLCVIQQKKQMRVQISTFNSQQHETSKSKTTVKRIALLADAKNEKISVWKMHCQCTTCVHKLQICQIITEFL